VLGHLGLLPALDAVDDHEAPAERERHRPQRERRVERGRALEHLERAAAPRVLGERAQRARRSPIRPWSSPWIRYAGLKVGTASRLPRHRPGAAR